MLREKEYTWKDYSFHYKIWMPDEEEKYLPTILYLPNSEEDASYEKFLTDDFQKQHRASVIVPMYQDWTDPNVAQAIQRMLFDVRTEHKMDICKTYLIGTGLGAVGAWHLAGSYPRVFAAMVAVGGCGDPYHARNAKYMPIWAFHSTLDAVNVSVPTTINGKTYLAGSRRLVTALRTDGAELVRYTEKNDVDPKTLAGEVWDSEEVWNWVFEQDRKNVVWITFIRPGLYRLDDWFMASAYLIEGKDQALLIDTTMTHADLYAVVHKLTTLPVSLAITHPHRDHMLHAFAFENVYINEKDKDAMYACIRGMYDMKAGKVPQRPNTNTYPDYMDKLMDFQNVIGLQDREVIDLGGDVHIEMIEVGGHTENHVVFADHGHQCLFTGDAVGSGYVVGVRYHEGTFHQTYSWYHKNLSHLIEAMKGKEDYVCYGGHFIQENSCVDPMQEDYLNGQSTYYIPLSWEVVEDMYILAQELADGVHDQEAHLDTGEEFFAKHGSAMLAGRNLERM